MNIYEDLVKYYPIGISRFEDAYFEYKGMDLVQTLATRKLNKKNYGKWKTLVKSAADNHNGVLSFNYESHLMDPAYSGYYVLDKQEFENVLFRREIHFHLSVLAPYYTVYGLKKISIQNKIFEEFQPLLIISPLDIYEQWFPTLRNEIEKSFVDYRFMDFSTLRVRPKGLSIAVSKVLIGQDASIFQAFFSPEDITNYKIMGDWLYS